MKLKRWLIPFLNTLLYSAIYVTAVSFSRFIPDDIDLITLFLIINGLATFVLPQALSYVYSYKYLKGYEHALSFIILNTFLYGLVLLIISIRSGDIFYLWYMVFPFTLHFISGALGASIRNTKDAHADSLQNDSN